MPGTGQVDKRPVVIVGPTASGKTSAAIELAKKVGAEIVSADSMAIYRGMNIGTAKPTPAEQQVVRFHMIDVVDPDEPFTVADYQEQASKVVDDILARGRAALVVGGSGLYVRALIDGLNIPGPGADTELRAELARTAEEKGAEYLHKRLAEVDPASAERLHPKDVKRVIRALEVYEQAGIAMSELLARTKAAEPRYPGAVMLGLTMDRQKLYHRIEDRVDEQIRLGLVEEVKGLLDRGYTPDLVSMQGLGYKEIAGFLNGEYDLETAVELLKRNTRRFAKRQYTWFRADTRIIWIDVDDMPPSEIADKLKIKIFEAGIAS